MRSMLHVLCFLLLLSACQNANQESFNLLNDVDPNLEEEWVNMVVEIPAGSTEKWEVNKENGQIEPDSLNGKLRIINYLGYPGNYGFIPQTLLSKASGGDGDPLDILVIGNSAKRGSILRCKVIGVLKLFDNGEQDDKLIAIMENSELIKVDDLVSLEQSHTGVLKIIETWFSHYKGKNQMVSSGFGSKEEAVQLIQKSIADFKD